MSYQVDEGRPCKACGTQLIFAKNMQGKIVPLEEIKLPKHVYNMQPSGVVQMVGELRLYVSHFTTCPSASQFSRSKN